MPPLVLLILTVFATYVHALLKKGPKDLLEIFLSYLLFFNIGVMGLIGFAAHAFMPDETAQSIGWPTGNPFQFEVAVANLAFGVLGVISFWVRGSFWLATTLGSCIYILGCFAGHLMQYFLHGNIAPNNIGFFIWVNDLLVPILALSLIKWYWAKKQSSY